MMFVPAVRGFKIETLGDDGTITETHPLVGWLIHGDNAEPAYWEIGTGIRLVPGDSEANVVPE